MTTMNVISRIPVTWPAEESPKRLTMTTFQKHSRWSVHLRDRPHSRQLPDRMSHLANRNFIVRMLFFATVIDCIDCIHSLSSCRWMDHGWLEFKAYFIGACLFTLLCRGTQRPPFPQTESQHRVLKCCGNFFTTQQFKTVVLWKIVTTQRKWNTVL